MIERKMQQAEEKRQIMLKTKAQKAHDEEAKVRMEPISRCNLFHQIMGFVLKLVKEKQWERDKVLVISILPLSVIVNSLLQRFSF